MTQCATPAEVAAALAHLCAADVRLRRVITQIGPYTPVYTPQPFTALVGSIVHQQVSMAAAKSMLRKLRGLCPGGRVGPTALLRLSAAELRVAGISRQKAVYLHSLAEAFTSHRLTPARLRQMNDDEVIAAVTAVKGIGRWTAEMLLIFCLRRPDVWPIDDLGLRKAAQRLLGREEIPRPAELTKLAAPWRPYRSVATWYLWRSLENPVPPSIGPA
jgi:DNA-3-methyladenine glycosylase II